MKIGIYNPYLATLGGGENLLACLAESLEAVLPHAAIDLITHDNSMGPDMLERQFGVSLRRCQLRVVPAPRTFWDPVLMRSDLARRWVHDQPVSELSAEYDLFINLTIFSSVPNQAARGIYLCMFPVQIGHPLRPWTHWRSLPQRANHALRRRYLHRMAATYDEVVSISAFTQAWTRTYWDVDSAILYPPVATAPTVDLSDKQHRILSVGRFFPGNHNKKHRPMIEAFRQLVDQGLQGWEYHLVGGVTDVPGTRAYLDELHALAAGYPIRLHLNAAAEELEALYRTSSLFWHATGFGEDEVAEPEKMEHFGISTVEAMNHGLVPVVIAQGGQPEIVLHGECGYLWRTLDELGAHTRALIDDPDRRRQMAHAAHARSLAFSRETFRLRVRQLVERLIVKPKTTGQAEPVRCE